MSPAAWKPSAQPVHLDPAIPFPQQPYMFVKDFERLEELRKKAEQAQRLQNAPKLQLGRTLILCMEKPVGWDALYWADKMKIKRSK